MKVLCGADCVGGLRNKEFLLLRRDPWLFSQFMFPILYLASHCISFYGVVIADRLLDRHSRTGESYPPTRRGVTSFCTPARTRPTWAPRCVPWGGDPSEGPSYHLCTADGSEPPLVALSLRSAWMASWALLGCGAAVAAAILFQLWYPTPGQRRISEPASPFQTDRSRGAGPVSDLGYRDSDRGNWQPMGGAAALDRTTVAMDPVLRRAASDAFAAFDGGGGSKNAKCRTGGEKLRNAAADAAVSEVCRRCRRRLLSPSLGIGLTRSFQLAENGGHWEGGPTVPRPLRTGSGAPPCRGRRFVARKPLT